MLVRHFNTYIEGGAATAARRLHAGLIKQGVDSRFHYKANTTGNGATPVPPDVSYVPTEWHGSRRQRGFLGSLAATRFRKRFRRGVRGRPSHHEIFTSPVTKTPTVISQLTCPSQGRVSQKQSPTTLHLHWVAQLIDVRSFFASVPAGQPVVWTLHDMNPFTGGCHFSSGCVGHTTGCMNCPQLPAHSSSSLAVEIARMKADAFADVNLHVAAPSRWLINQAKSSRAFQSARSFQHIPYGIDTDVFRPSDRSEARRELGLPHDKYLVCFGAASIENRRKGGQELVDALRKLRNQTSVELMVFGDGALADAAGLPPTTKLGMIRGDRMKRLVYNAADVFALPSLDDNLPLTGMESMACGTPVVGFRAGGIPDYVRPGESGLIADLGDAGSLANCLLQLVNMSVSRAAELRDSTRRMMTREYREDIEANAYRQLYAEINQDSVDDDNDCRARNRQAA